MIYSKKQLFASHYLISWTSNLLILCLFFLQTISAQDNMSGTRMKGQLTTSEVGTATYSVPVKLSPGTNLMPQLELVLNSHGGGSVNLAGLQRIDRQGSAVPYDQRSTAVGFNYNDRYALNGDRMVPTGFATYATRNNPHVRITAHGRNRFNPNPEYFTVETKDYLTLEFGRTTDARSGRRGIASMSYLLNKVTDAFGNYYTITYDKIGQYGEPVPKFIRYTGNSLQDLLPYNLVELEYSAYQGGVSFEAGIERRVNALLTTVTSYSDGEQLSKYEIEYDRTSQSIDDNNRVPTRITEYGRENALLGYLNLEHSQGKFITQKNHVDPISAFSLYEKIHHTVIVDINQDGVSDVVVAGKGIDGKHYRTILVLSRKFETQSSQVINSLIARNGLYGSAPSSGSDQLVSWQETIEISSKEGGESAQYVPGDFDGDARVDLAVVFSDRIQFYRNSPSYQSPLVKAMHILLPEDLREAQAVPLQANEDLPFELLLRKDLETRVYSFVGLSTGSQIRIKNDVVPTWSLRNGPRNDAKIIPVDLDADQDDDLVVNGDFYVTIFKNNGDGEYSIHPLDIQIQPGTTNNLYNYKILSVQAVDLNSDGLPELIQTVKDNCGAKRVIAHVNTDDTFTNTTEIELTAFPYLEDVKTTNLFFDYDLDGHIDYLMLGSDFLQGDPCRDVDHVNANDLQVYLGDGHFNFRKGGVRKFRANISEGYIDAGDINVFPGRYFTTPSINFLTIDKKTNRHAIYEFYAEPQAQLVAITDNLGQRTEITYQSILRSNVYRETNYAPDYGELRKFSSPYYVVAHVTVDNPGNGKEKTSYNYEDAITHRLYGFQGFRKIITTNHTNNRRTEALYQFDHRAPGPMLFQRSGFARNVLVALSQEEYEFNEYHSASSFRIDKLFSRTVTFDPIDGELLTDTRLNNRHDDFGNVTQSQTRYRDGRQEFHVNTYYPGIDDRWHARLKFSRREATAPGQDPMVREAAFEYGPEGALSKEIVAPDNLALRLETKSIRDGFGNVIEMQRTGLNSIGRLETRSTSKIYDDRGRFPIISINEKGWETYTVNDPVSGKVTKETDPNGLVTENSFDNFLRLIYTSKNDGSWERFQYETVDLPFTTGRAVIRETNTTAANTKAVVYRDLLERPIHTEVSAPFGRILHSDKRFNARGNLVAETDSYWPESSPQWHTYEYDLVDRETVHIFPDGSSTKTEYNHFETVHTNRRGIKTKTETDEHGNKINCFSGLGGLVQKAYNVFNQMVSLVGPDGVAATFLYDDYSHKLAEINPVSGVVDFAYTAFGEVKSNGTPLSLTEYHLDQLGRPILEINTARAIDGNDEFPSSDTIIISYDQNILGAPDQVTRSQDNYQLIYAYDDIGRSTGQTEVIDGVSFTTHTGYNDIGQESFSVSGASGDTIKKFYDHGIVTETRWEDQMIWQLLSQDENLNPTHYRQGNGTETFQTFDRILNVMLSTQTLSTTAQRIIQDWTFAYNLVGSLIFRYDNLTNHGENLAYDADEQLVSFQVDDDEPVLITYRDDGAIEERTDIGRYLWQNGRLDKVEFFEGRECETSLDLDFFFSSKGKVRKIEKDGHSLQIGYGTDNQRLIVEEWNNSERVKRKVYLPGEELIYSGGNIGYTIKTYVAGISSRPSAIISTKESIPIIQYLHYDHLGSITAITNEEGLVISRMNYDPWGAKRDADWQAVTPGRAPPGNQTTDRGYTFHEHYDLFSLALLDMNGRLFDAKLSIFISPDPARQNTDRANLLNRYSYVGNNPLSRTDPSGYIFKSIGKYLKNNWKSLVVMAVAIGVSVALPASGAVLFKTLVGKAIVGAAAGAAGGLTGSLLNGASFGQTMRSMGMGALRGAVSGLAAGMVAKAFDTEAFSLPKAFAHGMTQGHVNAAFGGSYLDGFLGGVAGELTANINNLAARTVASASLGGTLSIASGGTFANGAYSAAFVSLYNHATAELAFQYTARKFLRDVHLHLKETKASYLESFKNFRGKVRDFSKIVSPHAGDISKYAGYTILALSVAAVTASVMMTGGGSLALILTATKAISVIGFAKLALDMDRLIVHLVAGEYQQSIGALTDVTFGALGNGSFINPAKTWFKGIDNSVDYGIRGAIPSVITDLKND